MMWLYLAVAVFCLVLYVRCAIDGADRADEILRFGGSIDETPLTAQDYSVIVFGVLAFVFTFLAGMAA